MSGILARLPHDGRQFDTLGVRCGGVTGNHWLMHCPDGQQKNVKQQQQQQPLQHHRCVKLYSIHAYLSYAGQHQHLEQFLHQHHPLHTPLLPSSRAETGEPCLVREHPTDGLQLGNQPRCRACGGSSCFRDGTRRESGIKCCFNVINLAKSKLLSHHV